MNSADRYSLLRTWSTQAWPRIKSADSGALRYLLNPSRLITDPASHALGFSKDVATGAIQGGLRHFYPPAGQTPGASPGVAGVPGASAAAGGSAAGPATDGSGNTFPEVSDVVSGAGAGGASDAVAGAGGGGGGAADAVQGTGAGFLDSLKDLAGQAGDGIKNVAGQAGAGLRHVGNETADVATGLKDLAVAHPWGAGVVGAGGLAGLYALSRYQRNKGREEAEEEDAAYT